MVNLYVTEGKGRDPVKFYRNRVRIFIEKDMSYGLWIDEDFLFEYLNIDQKRMYLSGNSEESRRYVIPKEVAKKLIEKGVTPLSKRPMIKMIEDL
jgi:hypothetical protein